MAVMSNYQRMQIIVAWLVNKTQCILCGHTQLVDSSYKQFFTDKEGCMQTQHKRYTSSGLPNRLSRLKPTGPGYLEARDFVEDEFFITSKYFWLDIKQCLQIIKIVDNRL